MFFVLSKTLGLIAFPHYTVESLLMLAVLLHWLGRGASFRRWIVVFLVVYGGLLSTGAVSNAILFPLESQFTRGDLKEHPPAVIVVLTGMLVPRSLGSPYYELSGASDRVVEGVRLAHEYPDALLLITGGPGELGGGGPREAETLGRLARELGVADSRIIIEANARNTRENATETKKILDKLNPSGPILLVTSAVHMRRAVGCFEKADLRVVPWPVDFLRVKNDFADLILPSPGALDRSSAAIHEYLGWLVYRWAGYI